jgi:hypothetical protein
VHDALELAGWEVDVAGALLVKCLALLAAKAHRIETPQPQ